ncbi:MAG: glutamine--fructose-6-phosphate transaminase (isomerizing) [Candidatus Neomarinimicrobiota bacterium]
MCGIFGYVGKGDTPSILLKGLERLEYRGYDSSGIAILQNNTIEYVKKTGRVEELKSPLKQSPIMGKVGIAHTRWATHGEPNDINSHPHLDITGKIALVHNGIIENYQDLKKVLSEENINCVSDTDSEVLVQLISLIYNKSKKLTFQDSVRAALREVIGAYGIAVICSDFPEMVISARMGSPLVLGLGDEEYFIASDASPIVEHTRNVIYLDDGEMAVVNKNEHYITNIHSKKIISKAVDNIDLSIHEIEKGEYSHFMLKEIFDQKHSIADTMRGRLNFKDGTTFLGGIIDQIESIKSASRIYITACGTSWHAGLIGKHLIEYYARIPVHVEYASEFRYRNAIIDNDTVLLAISQSGETADTLAAIKKGKNKGALILGICNVVGSSISRLTHAGIYTHAGPEIGVASTKAFTAQVTVMIMLALKLGRKMGLEKTKGKKIIQSLNKISKDVTYILNGYEDIKKVAEKTSKAENFLYLGRGINFPVALEGALKLKEISYIHAEGYPAAEMKHGPIALIDEKMPVVILAPHDNTFLKILSNIQEVKSRKGIIITITDRPNSELTNLSDYVLIVPKTHHHVFPITSSIILQILAYEIALLKECDVDKPRNLAKSVTVE